MFLLILLLTIGCTQEVLQEQPNTFLSEEHGFSFSYPNGWDEVTQDLPNNWAVLKGENALIFTVEDAKVSNIAALGKIRALEDVYPANTDTFEQEKIDRINEIVNPISFNGQEWYTYAIQFSDKEAKSIVSGTLCEDKEITLVMISDFDSYELIKESYTGMLDTFSC